MKKNGTFIVANLYLNEVVDMAALPPAIAAKAKATRAAGAGELQAHARVQVEDRIRHRRGVFPHGQNAKEFTTQVRRGRAPLETIRSATIVNAELFGTPDRGRIDVGLLADIIGVEGNPLEDIARLERVTFVMKGGTIFTGPPR